MNILHTMIDDPDKKTEWIITELTSWKANEGRPTIPKVKWLTKYFNLKIDTTYSEEAYLYLLSFDHLEQLTKRFDYEHSEQRERMVTILSECIDCTKVNTSGKVSEHQKNLIQRFKEIEPSSGNRYIFAFTFINALNSLNDFFELV